MTLKSVTVVDYGLCNIDSMVRALEECGGSVLVTKDPRDVERAERIILPGVGSFHRAMGNLRDLGLVTAIRSRGSSASTPMLGVCLGMQLMASRGTEHGDATGLQLLDGVVEPLIPNEGERLPHIGWNSVEASSAMLMNGIPYGSDFYFVHSFHFRPIEPYWVVGTTPYAGGFCSVVGDPDRMIFGVQFHPEKSQKMGFRVLRNFLAI